jgi:hypothetical protein
MKAPKRALALLLFAFATGVAALSPSIYWRLYGWAFNESFWAGRPTTFWRDTIRCTKVGTRETIQRDQRVRLGYPDTFEVYRFNDVRPGNSQSSGSAFSRLTAYLTSVLRSGSKNELESISSDPDAAIVLTTLAGDLDPKISLFAARRLWSLAKKCPEVLPLVSPALRRAAKDTGVLDRREPVMTVGNQISQEIDVSVLFRDFRVKKLTEAIPTK